MNNKFEELAKEIRNLFETQDFIPLHEPRFVGREKEYLSKCIDSTFVSYLGEYVKKLEIQICQLTGSQFAITTDSGTSALHLALLGVGAAHNTEVITQALSFVATANAITYTGAKPIFLDVDLETMGLSPSALLHFLENNVELDSSKRAINKLTNKRIVACVPMHTFGNPCYIEQIVEICKTYNIAVVEDSAESLGSYVGDKHTGTFGDVGIFSFNGNKIVTCGGGGVVVTDNETIAKRISHISTTAKKPHPFEYFHDELGFNYRMPNLNAAVLSAQLENLELFLKSKAELAKQYGDICKRLNINLFQGNYGKSNNWLVALILNDINERNQALEILNNNKIMSRPIWNPLCDLPHYKDCYKDDLKNTYFINQRLINIPSSARINK